jgi:hypothetical protein
MDFVYNIYLIASPAGGIINLFPEAANFIDATITGSIYFYYI